MNCVFGGKCPESFFLDTFQIPAGYHKSKNFRTMLISTHNNDALGVGEFWKQAPLDTVLGGILHIIKMLHESYKKTNMAQYKHAVHWMELHTGM